MKRRNSCIGLLINDIHFDLSSRCHWMLVAFGIAARWVTADDIFAALSAEYSLTVVPTRGSVPAEEFTVNGGPETVGIIATVIGKLPGHSINDPNFIQPSRPMSAIGG